MDEIELDQRAWGKHERIKIARSHNAVDTVHCKNERQPRVRDGIKGLDGIGFEVDLRRQPPSLSRLG